MTNLKPRERERERERPNLRSSTTVTVSSKAKREGKKKKKKKEIWDRKGDLSSLILGGIGKNLELFGERERERFSLRKWRKSKN